MYWPCGVPRIYAYHGRTEAQIDGGEDEGNDESRLENKRSASDDGKGTLPGTGQTPTSTGDIGLDDLGILDLRLTRSDALFATITLSNLDIWASRPTVVLASLSRSKTSLRTYGNNEAVLFRPNSSVVVIWTSNGYLITYSIESDTGLRAYQQQHQYSQARRQSIVRHFGSDETVGLGEISLRFRRAIKIDAGINAVLALDQEIVVATSKPAAVQCIRWEPEQNGAQASAQLLSKMQWVVGKTSIKYMVHDRAMSLSIWLTHEGSAYAVQRAKPGRTPPHDSDESGVSSLPRPPPSSGLFDGFCFHVPKQPDEKAMLAAVNARFSLIAIATLGTRLVCYSAKDYVGNIPFSHAFRMPASSSATGSITSVIWSPDGYCLFVGFENGWATWSVFGKEGASSFTSNVSHSETNSEKWLLNIATASWTAGGAELLLTCKGDHRIWKMEMSRSAAVGCFSCANLVRALLQTPTELTIYRGHEMPDLTSISNEASLWHHAQYPAAYLQNQWPIKSCVVSQDGRYMAIAGRRGLAHYSLQSGRWRAFADSNVENSFAVRGGMCWFNHILAAATEHAAGYDLRLYSRDLDLGRTALHQEVFSMPIVFIGPSGEDSLLVYTHENILYHYVISITQRGAQLVQVGQIAFHGVVRAPSRVRSVSWVLPDSQLRNGDPSRDVECASVLFLVDDKLVFMQPSQAPDGALKYDMRVIAQHVEYYILMRDQIYFNFTNSGEESMPNTPSPGAILNTVRNQAQSSLRDSLWIFSGDDLRMWTDVRDVLQTALEGTISTDAPLLSVPVDFYPLSILLTKGVVLGIESELLQRRDVGFAQHRSAIRTQLFVPYILRQQLCDDSDTTAAFGLATQYQHLSYFPHALEILLHHVLDDEVDNQSRRRSSSDAEPSTTSPLPNILSFLQMVLPPAVYLSTIVNCIRKTELTSWRTLFAHLPTPTALFEQALELEDLKTASGYLIVLQGLEEEEDDLDTRQLEQYVTRLLKLARQKADFELCSELARFMIAIDPRGQALKRVIEAVGFREPQKLEAGERKQSVGLGLSIPEPEGLRRQKSPRRQISPGSAISQPGSGIGKRDYFSNSPGGL